MVTNNDVLVGKVQRLPNGTLNNQTELIWSRKEVARVDAVVKTPDADGRTIVHIRLRWVRCAEVGDKFALRNGQKGVIAEIVADEDMPFTWDGMRADVIMNPFAFITRRTVGQMYETLSGKASALKPPEGFLINGAVGSRGDCTPFSESFSLEEIQETLNLASFQSRGSERMFYGRTGSLMKASVFIGPLYYQQLVHFSRDKSYARGSGRRNPQTLQPPKGRSQDGGIKTGEMDVKCLNAHGSAQFLLDRFTHCSDGIEVYICSKCADVTTLYVNRCRMCGTDDVTKVVTPRAFLLFKNLIKTANIDMKVKVDPNSL
jgi:DNA-directed RNA polymerase beta subunit